MLQNNQLCGFCGNNRFTGQYFNDDFNSYPLGSRVTHLNSNNGSFSGTGWVIKPPYVGLQSNEDFTEYTLGDVSVQTLDAGGSGWADSFIVKNSYYGTFGFDNFNNYSDTTAINGGTNWEGNLIIKVINNG